MSPRLQRALHLGGKIAAHVLFWGWNLLFLSVLAFGLGPVLLFDTLTAAWMGLIPWSIAVFVPLGLSIPVIGMILGGWLFRHDGGRLLSLFFGVQFPLLALVMVRIFGLGQLVPSTTLLLVAFFVGALCQLRTLISGFSEGHRLAQVGRLIGQSTYLWIGLWIGALVGLFSIPIACEIGFDVFLWPRYSRSLQDLLLVLLYQTFALFTVAVFLAFPVAMVGITVRSWQVVHRASVSRIGLVPSWGWTAGTFASLMVATAVSSVQPQHRAIALLDAATDESSRREAVAHEEVIRRGLLNARLNRYRYLGPYSDDEVRRLYRRNLGRWSVGVAGFVWKVVAWPVTYHPVEPERPNA